MVVGLISDSEGLITFKRYQKNEKTGPTVTSPSRYPGSPGVAIGNDTQRRNRTGLSEQFLHFSFCRLKRQVSNIKFFHVSNFEAREKGIESLTSKRLEIPREI